MLRIKICGITSPKDGIAAAQAGADAIGIVFYPPSPRNVELARAAEILARLPPLVTRVGLFVNPQKSWVTKVLAQCPLDLLQFHGDEEEAFCNSFGRPYLKVLRVSGECDLHPFAAAYASAQGLLLDARHDSLYGGSGHSFPWWTLPRDLSMPVILAGGLTVANVAEAVSRSRPYAVDVSSGVESSPGRKDHGKMEKFIANARQAGER